MALSLVELIVICLCWHVTNARKLKGSFVDRLLAGDEKACHSGITPAECSAVEPKPTCTPYRSVDSCKADEAFQTYIQRRTAHIQKSNDDDLDAEGIWFHHLEDKLAGYKVASSLGLNPPKIYFCTDDVSTLSNFEAPSSGGFVVRATDFHSNIGIYVLPDGYGGKELITGVNMTAVDVESHLSHLDAKNVVIEQYVGTADSLPIEFKFHMFNGKVGSINVVANRGTSCACNTNANTSDDAFNYTHAGWAEMDQNQNRLDQYGCFTPGGTNEVEGTCTDIDFQTGLQQAHPMKGMDLCSELDRLDDCIMADMVAVAKKASEAIGVYVRVDMFLGSSDRAVHVQEFSTNHMNGLRHCSAVKNADGCIDPCFQGVLWKKNGGVTALGGPRTHMPDALRKWLALPNETTAKCMDIETTSNAMPLETTCTK